MAEAPGGGPTPRRVIPLDPELQPRLDEVRRAAADHAGHAVEGEPASPAQRRAHARKSSSTERRRAVEAGRESVGARIPDPRLRDSTRGVGRPASCDVRGSDPGGGGPYSPSLAREGGDQ